MDNGLTVQPGLPHPEKVLDVFVVLESPWSLFLNPAL